MKIVRSEGEPLSYVSVAISAETNNINKVVNIEVKNFVELSEIYCVHDFSTDFVVYDGDVNSVVKGVDCIVMRGDFKINIRILLWLNIKSVEYFDSYC